MKTRIISGVVGFILLIAVILSGSTIFSIVVALAAVIGMYEFYNALHNVGFRPFKILGYIACIPVLLIGLKGSEPITLDEYSKFFGMIKVFAFGLFLAIAILFALSVFFNNKYNVLDIAVTIFGMFYVPFLFVFVVMTRNLEDGKFYVWMIIFGAFATDTFAYFAGKFFGKRKLLPVISPKKTVEGSIGGIIGSVFVMLVYGIVLNLSGWIAGSIGIYHFIILGILCGVISQLGDWAASSIKRYVKIKDYGNLIPGHGGVLDRCDSILFVAPVVYFYMSML